MRGVPSTLINALSMSSPVEPTDVTIANAQHDAYSEMLNNIVPNIIELESNDLYPDCVFIEDTAVVVDDKAVICRIGAESRRGEVDQIKKTLLDLDYSIYDMRSDTETATCDGGDVLYPVSYNAAGPGDTLEKRGGNHMFVGLSSRTNQEGADYLQKVFPHVEVVAVQMGDINGEALHLKSIVTHIDEETLLAPAGEEWDSVYASMGAEERAYKIIRLPDINACNVVSVNGNIIAQPSICNESKLILQREVEKRGMKLLFVGKFSSKFLFIAIEVPHVVRN